MLLYCCVCVCFLGSSYCRMGWAGDADPAIVFRNAIARNRAKKVYMYYSDNMSLPAASFLLVQGESDLLCVGNDISSVEVVRSSLRSQFDRSLVSNFTYQEQLLDYGFSHLGLHKQTAIRHPVVMTEPVCNPGYCRCDLVYVCVCAPFHSPSPPPLVPQRADV